MAVEKTRNNGQWTEARYTSFIKSALRSATGRWGPKQNVIREARVSRGMYKCSCCEREGPATLPPKEGNKRRIRNIIADHEPPIIDPAVGFTNWDDYIKKMFCEIDGFQAVCHECHTKKTKEERQIATERRRNEKL